MIEFHPAIPFIIAGIAGFVLKGTLQRVSQLTFPVMALFFLFKLDPHGGIRQESLLDLGTQSPLLIRMDKLSFLFALAFLIFGIFAHLFALHDKNKEVSISSNFYIASSLGAVLAGDIISFFVFWELMAITSVVLVWNKEKASSLNALFRYFLYHLAGGLFFFVGVITKIMTDSPLTFTAMPLDFAGIMIFIGFAINAALVPFHTWLPDAYPAGTPTSSIYLSAFTSKVAVYAFARAFAGEEILIYLGVIAAIYGVIYALMENDMRKLLSYHIVCQIGYMVVGIGIGSHTGVSAGTGHAVGNILFKGLLFMATGALIYMSGTHKLNELGKLSKKCRATLIFFMLGAFAIGGMPFLNGYITKSLLFKSVHDAHHWAWLDPVLLLVAVGTFLSIALKLSYFAFWGDHEYKGTLKKAPLNMYLAMGGLSALCIYIGTFPNTFYHLLPYETHDHPFKLYHVIHTLELLGGTYLGFLLIRKKLHAKDTISLDIDWFFRKTFPNFIQQFCIPISYVQEQIQQGFTRSINSLNDQIRGMNIPLFSSLEHPFKWIVQGCLFVAIVIYFTFGLNF